MSSFVSPQAEARIERLSRMRPKNHILASSMKTWWRGDLPSHEFDDGSDGGRGRSLPEMRQQLSQVTLLERGQTVEHVLQISPWMVPVELGRLDQAEQPGRAFAGLL